MSEKINVKAIIKIDGKEYSKNGTSVDVNLIIGTKYQIKLKRDWKSARNMITSISVSSIKEAFTLETN